MSVFKGKDWIRKTKVQLQDLTAKVKLTRINKETTSRVFSWMKENKIAIAKGWYFQWTIGIYAKQRPHAISPGSDSFTRSIDR